MPAALSVSGGRTSGKMLYRYLQQHGGALPATTHALFADTGQEHQATYKFLRDMAERWDVHIEWVAYPKGEHPTPYDALIAKKRFLPNPVARFCTEYLKVKPIAAFMRAKGYDQWDNIVGIRADEPARISRIRAKDNDEWVTRMPLADAGVTEADVFAFWNAQNFDLGIPRGFGNCTWCFLKSYSQLVAIEQAQPGSLEWPATKETEVGGTFRSDRPSYAEIIRFASQQGTLPFHDEPLMECFCHD
jgi:3'-phosphoadenosine 5'-phosphosulfate sulfotransferase (PAPS reductase)/FAD synthetase